MNVRGMSVRETTFRKTFRKMSRGLVPALLLACLLWVGAPAHADAPAGVVLSTGGGSLTFEAQGPWQGLRMTLGGPDGQVRVLEADGLSLSVDRIDGDGEVRPDGVYVWELRGLTPADAVDRSTRRASDEREVLIGSGHFTIADSSFVSPDVEENPGGTAAPGTAVTEASSFGLATDEFTFSDDLIVQRSLCVGFDCVSNESFGFDTIRLKENNLRIHFLDTSTAGAFPSNDWRLVANDSQNGGANRFSIENASTGFVPFTVLANAGNNALFVDHRGVGVGTSIPVLELHVRDGDTPGLRLEQDTSSSFSAQTWDVAGNEVNFFIRDSSRLPFRLFPGAPSNSLVIAGSGDVGIGTATPSARLEVIGDIAVSGTVDGRDVSADGALLDSHVADFSNPHQVTAAQAGADPAGTAAAAVDGHEAAFDHTDIPSALPVPVAEGGTGATDAATARANLGIVQSKAGIVAAASFTGNPAATATVTFASPYPAGTEYAVLATAFTSDAKKVIVVNLTAKDETGFTLTLGEKAIDLVEVSWLARPVGE